MEKDKGSAQVVRGVRGARRSLRSLTMRNIVEGYNISRRGRAFLLSLLSFSAVTFFLFLSFAPSAFAYYSFSWTLDSQSRFTTSSSTATAIGALGFASVCETMNNSSLGCYNATTYAQIAPISYTTWYTSRCSVLGGYPCVYETRLMSGTGGSGTVLGIGTITAVSSTTAITLPTSSTTFALLSAPTNGAFETNSVPVEVYWNSKTYATTSLLVSFYSLNQDLTAFATTVNAVSNGIHHSNFTVDFPYYDDIIYVKLYLYENGSGVPAYISKEYSFSFVANGDVSRVSLGGFRTGASSTCASSDTWSGGLCHAGLLLFVPSEESLALLGNKYEELQGTFPFVYAFEAQDLMETLFTATSTDAGIVASTTLGTITFINRAKLEAVPYSSTFRTIIGYGMWLAFLWGAYRRVVRIFNSNEATV